MSDLLFNIRVRTQRCKLLAIGGSAGSFADMIEWVKQTKVHSIVLILHRSKQHKSNLAPLMRYFTKLTVKEVEEGELFQENHLYIAPAGYHLVIDSELHWHLSDANPVWFCKPAIDVLFDSLAINLKENVSAVLLSGANEDGGLGLRHILDAGGATFCVDPYFAEYDFMPKAAIKHQAVQLFFEHDDIKEIANTYFP